MITKKTTSSRAVLMPDGTTTMYTVHITADTAADIPTPEKDWDAGSRCDVLENGGKTYLLNNAGQWEEVHFFGNGGGTAPVDVYTKAETDELLGQKADKSEVTESVTAAVAQIVADAPEDFNTLREMSDWITQHEDSAAAMNTAILQNAADIEAVETQQTEQAEVNSAATEGVALNRSTLGYQRKNLLWNNCKTITRGGITAAVNEDGSITFNGTSTVSNIFTFFYNMETGSISSAYTNNKKWIPNGKYILSTGINTAVGVYLHVAFSTDNISESRYVSSVNEGKAEFEVTDADKYVWARIRIGANASFDNITIYPMIRPAEITDDTYEPYKPSVQEQIDALIDRISALESSQTNMVTSQNMSDEIVTMNVEDEEHERTENMEQTD